MICIVGLKTHQVTGWLVFVWKAQAFRWLERLKKNPHILRLGETKLDLGEIVENENAARSWSEYQSARASSKQRDEEVRCKMTDVSKLVAPKIQLKHFSSNFLPDKMNHVSLPFWDHTQKENQTPIHPWHICSGGKSRNSKWDVTSQWCYGILVLLVYIFFRRLQKR